MSARSVVSVCRVVVRSSILLSPCAAKQRPCGRLLPGAARAEGLEWEKRLRRDPAARSRSAAEAEEAGWKPLWGRKGATPLGPLCAASAATTRVSVGSRTAETPSYRRLKSTTADEATALGDVAASAVSARS